MRSYVYGHNKTIHQTRYVDVETDPAGNVVAVWFRCLMLPFKQSRVNITRADSVKGAKPPALLAVEVVDE